MWQIAPADRHAATHPASGTVHMGVMSENTYTIDPFEQVSETEAAELLGISIRTLRRWRDAGIAPPHIQQKKGGHVRYRKITLLKHLVQQELSGAAA